MSDDPQIRGKKATEMKKKFLMVLLTVMAAFAVFTINASAATSGNCGPPTVPLPSPGRWIAIPVR